MKSNTFFILICIGMSHLVLTGQEDADNPDRTFIPDNLYLSGSLMLGTDTVDLSDFGFDTVIMREHNLRMFFDDTSIDNSTFPKNDWRFTFNDRGDGGANYFSVDDVTAGTVPFRVDAGAGDNVLRVESDGGVGLGTRDDTYGLYVAPGGKIGIGNTDPVLEVHATGGDSPALRLEQDSSSGFTPQVWDLAGNESNFFIRDVTNASNIPFTIKVGAPRHSFTISNEGGIGLGFPTSVSTPLINTNAALHLGGTNKGMLFNRMTTEQRTAFGANLGTDENGMTVYDTEKNKLYVWNGATWTAQDDDQQLIFNSPNLSIADGNTVDLSPLLSDLESRVTALETAAGASGTDLTPDLFNYQAVVRDNAGDPLTSTLINLRMSINTSDSNGSEVYTELHTVTTNDNGVAEFAIGSGIPVLGTIAAIDWSGNTHYLKVEMDVTGGTNFELVGFTQLLSVPYALHAKSAESIDGVSRAAVSSMLNAQEEIKALRKENAELKATLNRVLEHLNMPVNKED